MQEPVALNSPQTQTQKLLDTASGYQFSSLDATDSFSSGNGQYKDDMQSLLPNCKRLSKDNLSRTSLTSESEDAILAQGETTSETSLCSEGSPPCDLSLIERLLFTHPVWFLPGIQRSGAVHLLQSKEEGNFIVRGSSHPNTMALSVRQPPEAGPYIEHYLIQSTSGILCLESSRFKFDSIPALIAHYSQCCDELPVQLILPNALRSVKNRQQLSSLALLGQEFWRYPMSCSKPNEKECILDAKSPNSTTDTSGIGTTILSDSNCAPNTQLQSVGGSSFVSNVEILSSLANTPSDTTCSMSSFTLSRGQQVQSMRLEFLDSVKNSMSSLDLNKQRNGIFKLNDNSPNEASKNLLNLKVHDSGRTLSNSAVDEGVKRPKPPNTLNFDLRRVPVPPLTWWKPLSPDSNSTAPHNDSNNITVTTTVTFSMDKATSPQFVEIASPNTNKILNSMGNSYITFQTFSKRLSPEGECKDSFSSQGSFKGSRGHCKDTIHQKSPMIFSENVSTNKLGTNKNDTTKSHREAKHYRESDILQSPEIYCQSAQHDKISDVEDMWSHDTDDRVRLLSSFKTPNGQQGKRPDLLPESATVVCHNATETISVDDNTYPPNHALSNMKSIQNISNLQNHDQLVIKSQKNVSTENHTLPCQGKAYPTQKNAFEKTHIVDEDDADSSQELILNSNQSSPFYAEPADAVKKLNATVTNILRRPQRNSLLPASQRHSEPSTGGFMRTPINLKLVTSEVEKITVSLDELEKNQEQLQLDKMEKPLAKRSHKRFEQWQLDSSWEFMRKTDDNDNGNYEDFNFNKLQKGKLQEAYLSDSINNVEDKAKPVTIHEIIANRLPDFNFSELTTLPYQTIITQRKDTIPYCRLSSYDNVERNYSYNPCFFGGLESSQSDDGTVFSEPWDSSQWESVLPQHGYHTRNKIVSCNDGPGESVRSYTLHLAQDLSTTFARNIENFICCTKESREVVPHVVMRNMRQFMNGMKNYLVKHGESKFHEEVEAARARLRVDEFLNLDAILETVMHQLIILPLREHLYGMFVDYYTRSNDIQLLAQNVKYACSRKATEFGIRPVVMPPSSTSLQIISNMLLRFQETELPLEKLDLFLHVISTIFETSNCVRGQQLGADDFLPILVYVVAKCGFIGAEIEAEFIWGLVQPTLLNGESGYYLTALCSAAHVLKNFTNCKNERAGPYDLRPSSIPALSSVLRVIIPDECNGSLQTRTLPVRPHTTTREVCRIIAHKARITNPQDYGLFKLVDGEETILNDTECPQNTCPPVKDKPYILVYKRIDAKIVWPTITQPFLN